MTKQFTKDPDATLDYAFDWTDWLAASETITSHTIIADIGITVTSSTHTAAVVTAWLTGGTAGNGYGVTCRITTSAGRTDDRSATVLVRER